MERPEGLQWCPNALLLAGNQAEVGETLARPILDLAGAEVVEEGVDGEVASFSILDWTAEGLYRGGRSARRISAMKGARRTTVGILLPSV